MRRVAAATPAASVELTRPAIVTLSENAVVEGARISASGLRFTSSDRVLVDGVRPVITTVTPDRAEPGQLVTVTGSGFAVGATVLLNGEDMPEVTVTEPHVLRFRVRRPESIAPNPDGETASMVVMLGDRGPDSRSDPTPLRLRTFRMLVMGDSVAWGQGLLEEDKFWSRTAELVRSRNGGIGVYPLVRAHSGAVLGIGVTAEAPPLDGEIPTPLPTVVQQLQGVATELSNDELDDVRLVLLTGGINDISLFRILDPLIDTVALLRDIDQRCRNDMVELLSQVVTVCPQARVVVTGYFPILSTDSDTAFFEALLIATGVLLQGTGTAVALTAAARAKIIENCQIFADGSRNALSTTVTTVNASRQESRIVFVDPAFGPSNAVYASGPLLFGADLDLGSQDAVAGSRAVRCSLAPPGRTEEFVCERASVGHPNRAGAVRFADAIAAVL